MTPLRIVFMGTARFAVPTLAEIVGAGHAVSAVYTQPARPAGRGLDVRKSPVHLFAEQLGLPVLTPSRLRTGDAQARFAAHGCDVAVVAAYGLILPGPVLKAPEYGCLNLHASLLPRWRGAAPIQRAIMAGDTATGVTIMRMEEGLDTGAVCLAKRVAIGPDESAGELHDRLSGLGADLTLRALAALGRGVLDCTPQPETGVTYAHRIANAETRIDWSRPAPHVHNHIRGLSPAPGAWFEIADGGKRERVKALRAERADGSGAPGSVLDERLTVACGDGAVRLLRLQRAGGKPVDADAFLRGRRLASGTVLT